MKKIAIIIGTRPEAIKLIPVYEALKDTFNVTIISTGQHRQMLEQIFLFFGVRPDVELNLMTANQTLSQITSLLFARLDNVLLEVNPDLVIVQGDTTSAMAACLVAYYHKISVAHIEAGLRSNDKYAPFPEEINRKIISVAGDLHFVPTPLAAEHLRKENILKNVYVVGNTVIDSLLNAKEKVNLRQAYYESKFAAMFNRDQKFILITTHRRESFGQGIKNICSALRNLALQYSELKFIFPVHFNPNVRAVASEMFSDLSNVHLIEPVPYDEMVFLMENAHMIMTDSGGIQEEAPAFHVPVIVMRDVTERTEGIDAGCAVLAGTEVQRIVAAFEKIHHDKAVYQKMSNTINPYGDGNTANNIARILKEHFTK